MGKLKDRQWVQGPQAGLDDAGPWYGLLQPFVFRDSAGAQIWYMHLRDADDGVLTQLRLAAGCARHLEDQIETSSPTSEIVQSEISRWLAARKLDRPDQILAHLDALVILVPCGLYGAVIRQILPSMLKAAQERVDQMKGHHDLPATIMGPSVG